MARLLRLALLVFAASYAGSAHAFVPVPVGEMVISVIGAVLLCIGATVWVMLKMRSPLWYKIMSALLICVLLFPAAAYVIFFMCLELEHIQREHESAEYQRQAAQKAKERERQWLLNPLRTSACNGQLARFTQELASGKHDADAKQRALQDCIIPKSDVAAMRVALDELIEKSDDSEVHCPYLSAVLQGLDTQLLEVFVERQRSLTCASQFYPSDPLNHSAEHRPPSWWDVFKRRNEIPPEALLKTLRYLQAHEVDLTRIVAGHSLLTIAVEEGNYTAILFALDLGMDPDDKAYRYEGDLSPKETWVLRRFHSTYRDSYSALEREKIQARFQEMTPAQADAMARKLHRKQNLESFYDGGADFVAYLVARKANMRRLNSGGNLIFGNTRISPELLQVLAKLDDGQLKDFICPEIDEYDRAFSLYEEAVSSENKVLLAFLQQRKMPRKCP